MPSTPLEAKLWNPYQVCIYSTPKNKLFWIKFTVVHIVLDPIRSYPCCFEFHSQHVVCVVNQQKQSIYFKFADDISHLQTYTLTINKMLLLFSQLSVVIRLDKVSEINYALLKAPEFTSTYVETQHKVICMLKTT